MSYKEEDCLMYYRYKKNEDGSETPEKVFVAPNLVLLMLLKKLGLELKVGEYNEPAIEGVEIPHYNPPKRVVKPK